MRRSSLRVGFDAGDLDTKAETSTWLYFQHSTERANDLQMPDYEKEGCTSGGKLCATRIPILLDVPCLGVLSLNSPRCVPAGHLKSGWKAVRGTTAEEGTNS